MLDKLQGLAGQARLAPEKRQALERVLQPLGAQTAAKIALGIERQRLDQPDQLPYSDILASIRPKLRQSRPPRTPTLLRLICDGFEAFLINERMAEKRVAEIPRSTISILWLILQEHPEAHRLTGYDAMLTSALKQGEQDEVLTIGLTVRKVAGELLTETVNEWPDDGRLPRCAPLGRVLVEEEVEDLKEIAVILSIADKISAAIGEVEAASPLSRAQLSRQMLRLDENMVMAAKTAYMKLSQKAGNDAKFFALALMTRLENPAEILILPRALALSKADRLMHNSELAILGDRLLTAMEEDVERFCYLAYRTARDGRNFHRQGTEVAELLARLQAQFLGMTTEIDIKRSGPWGERLMEIRRAVAAAMEEAYIEASMSAVLIVLAFDPQYDDPTEEEVRAAELGEECLQIANRVADILGFAGVMRSTMRELIRAIDQQVEAIDEMILGEEGSPLHASGEEARIRALAVKKRLWRQSE